MSVWDEENKKYVKTIAGCGCMAFLTVGFLALMAVEALGIMTGTPSNITIEDGRTDITKEEWFQIFKAAESSTGTPWELTAAIVYSETGGGTNFGGCSYFAPAPSRGHVLSSSQVRSENDRDTFEEIVEEISYPKNEPVSCNADGANGDQNGGAIGYMQVMPPEWRGSSNLVISNEVALGPLNPWNAQDAAYVASMVLRNKAGVIDIEAPFPEDDLSIRLTISKYLGHDEDNYTREYLLNRPYVVKTFAAYKEFKAAGEIP